MATTLTITPQASNTLTVTNSNTVVQPSNAVTTLTISSAIAGAAADAQGIAFANAARTISTATTVEQALLQLADQLWVQTTAPTAGTTNLAEGDFFYDTDDNQLKIYRETSIGNYSFVPVMIGNDSADSDTIDAGSF
jgi:hypothetical protein|tara:strand:- start:2049 stop:2459 length:411 start_codon:yes stop_codon:yes gene_type:complete